MKVTCDNCGHECDEDDVGKTLFEIHQLAERLTPGGIVPAGECSECGCFMYLDEACEEAEIPARNEMNTTLKSCPFCGGKPAFDHDDNGWNWIHCTVCDASTNARVSAMDDCKPLLAEQWNRRAQGTLKDKA